MKVMTVNKNQISFDRHYFRARRAQSILRRMLELFGATAQGPPVMIAPYVLLGCREACACLALGHPVAAMPGLKAAWRLARRPIAVYSLHTWSMKIE